MARGDQRRRRRRRNRGERARLIAAAGDEPLPVELDPWWRPTRSGRTLDRMRFGWINRTTVVAALVLICGSMLAIGAYDTWSTAEAVRDRGVETEATVLHVDRDADVLTVRFVTTTGEVVSVDVDDWRWQAEPRRGDRLAVVYDPLDPRGLVVDARDRPGFTLAVLLALAAAACTVYGAGLLIGRFGPITDPYRVHSDELPADP